MLFIIYGIVFLFEFFIVLLLYFTSLSAKNPHHFLAQVMVLESQPN